MKERILLLGHGSPNRDANKLHHLAKILHARLHPGCAEECVSVAYLQFGEPGLMAAIKDSVGKGPKRIIVHPFFLSAGRHVTAGIPVMMEEARRLYPDVAFLVTDPLGIHEKMADIVLERIREAETK